MDLYLRIAPELYFKAPDCRGWKRSDEINRNFRNEGISTRHNPEFTMLEIYQAYGDFQTMMDLAENMIATVVNRVNGSMIVEMEGEHIDFTPCPGSAYPCWRPLKNIPAHLFLLPIFEG